MHEALGTGRADQFARFEHALDHTQGRRLVDAPLAVIDLDAFDANAADMLVRSRGVPIRVASKSVRCTALLRYVLQHRGFHGILAFSLAEAIHLVRSGVSDDVVVAYPTAQRAALQELAAEDDLAESITLMMDHPDQLELIHNTVGQRHTTLRLCMDLDCSLRLGPLHLGARRSPLRTPEQARNVVEHVKHRVGRGQKFRLVGLMGYEAQIAGMTDTSPAVRAVKRLSVAELSRRRAAVVAQVKDSLSQAGLPPLEFVNGGGTGSIESTVAEPAVTEVAAGSGLYGPHLFDHYRAFSPSPAAFFAVDVVRTPGRKLATVFGGGWAASGVAGPDRLPVPVWPPGLRLLKAEGAGEVQTPLRCHGETPPVGTRVWMRHTKAGELCERVNELHLIRGDRIVATVPTYRGERKAF